jgi:hypothetical protein
MITTALTLMGLCLVRGVLLRMAEGSGKSKQAKTKMKTRDRRSGVEG